MKSIQIDDDVYQALEHQVTGFSDNPNSVLRRILQLDQAAKVVFPVPQRLGQRAESKGIPKNPRGKAPKANLRTLVGAKMLKDGQTLFLHDYQGQRVSGEKATVSGNSLMYEGSRYSMSALARDLLKDTGYHGDSYRGPLHWYTAEGTSIKDLWANYLAARK